MREFLRRESLAADFSNSRTVMPPDSRTWFCDDLVHPFDADRGVRLPQHALQRLNLIRYMARIFERGRNIEVFQIRVVGQDLFACRPACEHVENVFDADAQTANARPPAANAGIYGDPVQDVTRAIILFRRFRIAPLCNAS